MNRREVLQQVAWMMGGAISAPAILGMLNGCTAKPDAGWKPVFLSDKQIALVAEVVEIMIPRTDTPGAKDVGIPSFIDSMLKDAYPQPDRDRYNSGLADLDAQARSQHGRSFMELDPKQRLALVQATNDSAAAAEHGYTGNTIPERPFILMTKELALLGYFTSEAGATQVLQYVPVPGPYRGCVAVSEAGNGKTWATETSSRF
jgi:gluconate 2-dehydrogenase gamma chain